MHDAPGPAVWFPAVRAGTGTDVFTERLVAGLRQRGLRAEIRWLPLRAEYAPWSVPVPAPPAWATVVHVNSWLHPRFIPAHLPVLATLHHAIHDPALRPYKGWLRAAYHRHWIAPIERRVLRRADRVVAVSRYVAEMARQTLCDVPMQVIHNGIDTEAFTPGSRQRQPGEPFRLLYVGSWMARKGVDLLAPILRELGEGFELRYTGGAAEYEKRAMPRNMHDLGRLDGAQVRAAMQQADAFLFPSRSEGLPLVAIEAMACGLPVIATRGSALDEVVEDGVTGLLCTRDDVKAFAAAARIMATDRQRIQRMAAAAQASVAARFPAASMLDAYLTQYNAFACSA
ncbi:MAG TPA: glycosyltransferase family 4 protein [Rhodanobacteraceae bacterium]|nr:glycosyltransferase family 4 protein [Rhodanobacteraceae bacterium]